MLVVRNR